MKKFKPYSASFLTLGGFLLAGMGIYFVFLRAPLLPEDLRYMNTTMSFVQSTIPGFPSWIQKVLLVMGGYVFTTGLLTIYVAQTSFRLRTQGSFVMISVAGITSTGP